jgi:hypothetical protein
MIKHEGTVLVTKNRVRIIGFHFEDDNPVDDVVDWVTSRIRSTKRIVEPTARGARIQARLGYWLIGLANRLIQNGGG